MNNKTKFLSMSNQLGVSLVETMVALFILAVGTLGVLAMQVNALRVNQNAYLFSQAGFLAENIAESMRSHALSPSGSMDDYITFFNGPGDTCSSSDTNTPNGTKGTQCALNTTCNDLVAHDIWQWCGSVGANLPLGRGAIEQVAGAYQITISFQQESVGDTSDDRSIYTLRVQ